MFRVHQRTYLGLRVMRITYHDVLGARGKLFTEFVIAASLHQNA